MERFGVLDSASCTLASKQLFPCITVGVYLSGIFKHNYILIICIKHIFCTMLDTVLLLDIDGVLGDNAVDICNDLVDFEVIVGLL